MKKAGMTASAVLAAVMMISGYASAGPLANFQSALVYLQKARMTFAVQAKTANLKKAKEQLVLANYNRGGNRAAALAFTMQAIAKVNDFKLDQANQKIDMAIVKVKHSILALKQENAARKKSAPARK